MIRGLLLIVACVILAACARVEPVYNVNNQMVVTGSGKTPSDNEVRSAIVQAAATKSWQVKELDTRHLEATLQVRKHTAKVVIEYSPKAYSINYKDSEELLHKGDVIHRRYNAWVKGLSIAINKRLAKL